MTMAVTRKSRRETASAASGDSESPQAKAQPKITSEPRPERQRCPVGADGCPRYRATEWREVLMDVRASWVVPRSST